MNHVKKKHAAKWHISENSLRFNQNVTGARHFYEYKKINVVFFLNDTKNCMKALMSIL